MYNIKLWIHRLSWRLIVWLLWHQSEALRKDWADQAARQLLDNVDPVSFDWWLTLRIFGDTSGYRPSQAIAVSDEWETTDEGLRVRWTNFSEHKQAPAPDSDNA